MNEDRKLNKEQRHDKLAGQQEADAAKGLTYLRDSIALRFGPTASPLNAFLIHQGLETLSLRVERQSANALAVASWLERQPEVAAVDYAGLASSPYHRLAARYLPNGQGSVFAVTLRDGLPAARAVVDAFEVFAHMTHLGLVASYRKNARDVTRLQKLLKMGSRAQSDVPTRKCARQLRPDEIHALVKRFHAGTVLPSLGESSAFTERSWPSTCVVAA